MMFNNILEFTQKNLNFLYENSTFLQNIDKIILPFILLTFIVSMFMSSDFIGFVGIIIIFLTFIKLLICPGQRINLKIFEVFL